MEKINKNDVAHFIKTWNAHFFKPCEFLLLVMRPASFTRIIYAMHSILRIGAVHGYLSNYEQVCALLDWSGPSQTMEYLFFLQRSFFPFGTIWK
jgi:hypothetical protein